MKVKPEARMNQTRCMKIAADLIKGDTDSAALFLAENPTSIDKNGTWENVVAKLCYTAKLITDSRATIVQPVFAVFNEAGNVKLPFAAFSSMAIIDCAGYGECGKWCYSKTAWRHPNAWGRQVANSMLLRSEAGRKLVTEAFHKLKSPILRLYVDGDFHSRENLQFWMDLIKTRPEIQVYGYSKSWVEFIALKLAGYEWPANYTLNLSSGSRHDDTLRQIMATLPVTRGEFIAVPVARHHMTSKAYQSKRNDGFAEYSKNVRQSAGKRVFVCAGKCGDCLPDGTHACGSRRFDGVTIAIGVH